MFTIAEGSKLFAQMNAPQGSLSKRRDIQCSIMKGWRKRMPSSLELVSIINIISFEVTEDRKKNFAYRVDKVIDVMN